MHWIDLAVGGFAAVTAALAAFFAWRNWLRDRPLVGIRFSTERRAIEGTAAEPRHLHLRIAFQCRRGTVRVQGIGLQGKRGGQASRGESFVGDTTHGLTLGPGGEVETYFLADRFAAAHGVGAATFGCWWDAEDKGHCVKIPSALVAELLAENRG